MAENENKIIKKRTLLQKIVNVFLYAGISIIILLLAVLGFSQTSTFRNYLRNTVVEQANKALNGKISIGKIDGTIFTSLVLRNTVVSMDKDTLLNAGIIELKTSPLQIFFKRIYIRKLELKDAKVALIKDSTGELNISKLIPPSAPDTTHSKFPFKIYAADVKLTNIDLSLHDYNKANSKQYYDSLNLSDLRVSGLNLALSAAADIKEDEYELNIKKLSCFPNLNFFKLNNLSGQFLVSKKGVVINNLNILSAGSDVTLQLKANDLNLFDSASVANLNKVKLNLTLNADKFNFDDLSSFIESTNMLKGTVSAKLVADGTVKDINISELKLDYLETHLNLKGKINNIDNVQAMLINAEFYNSGLNEPDINKLLPKYGIPVYDNLGVIEFDTLKYVGNPLNFKTVLSLRTKSSSIFIDGGLDFTKPAMSYDVNFSTKNLDVSPFLGMATSITSNGTIKGSGVNPEQMNAAIKFLATRSSFNGSPVDSLKFNAEAKDKNINYSFAINSAIANAELNGKFDFSNKSKPSYDFKGAVRNLNLSAVTSDTSIRSNLNFKVDASGDNFDLDKMNLFLALHLDKSAINSINIDSARTIIDIRSSDNGERIINLISDLADVTLEGDFSLKQSVGFLARESNIISSALKSKINQIMYPDSVYNKQVQTGIAGLASKKKQLNMFKPSRIKYLIEFKNFDLLSLLLGSSHLRLNGDISGDINNSADSAIISCNSKFDYIKYWSENDVFFLSNLDMKINLANNLDDTSFANIYSNLHVTTDRVFAGNDLKNILLDLNLDKSMAKINISAQLEDYLKAQIKGGIDFSSNIIKTDFNKLDFSYNNFKLTNNGNVNIDYSPDNIVVNHFELLHNGGKININGSLKKTGEQDLKLFVKGIQGKDLSENLFNTTADNSLGANLNISGEVKGNFESPVINLMFNADSISFRNTYFGFLKSNFNYSNQNINVDLKFLDTTLYKNEPPLVLYGNVPINLSFIPTGKRFPESKQIDLTLSASNFNLGALGNLVPMIDKLKGNLNASIKVNGTLQNIEPSGNVTITNADFVSESNNLEYTAGLKLNIKNQKLFLDSLLIANAPGTKGGGTITGGGEADLNNFELASARVAINGSLKVLSEASKSVSPAVYGDLIIETNGDIVFTSNGKRSFVNAPIIVKEARLTFPPSQSAYQNSAENFIYRYLSDTVKVDTSELDFENLVKLAHDRNSQKSEEANEKPLLFDYVLNVKVQNEAILKFILAKELNQNLTAILKGDFQYQNIGGKPNAQGELTLLEGSTLEFLKTFEAAGTIRFESELSNPYLNIIATYKNYYTPPDAEGKEEQVAVKVKLNGPLKDLSKNFIQEKNNIAVYVGSDDITNDKPDPTKDISDAVMFILTGKFASDLTQQQQSQAVAQSGAIKTTGAFTSTATSLAGSLLGGFLNHYLGDYVRGVELKNVGSTTKFNLVGKVKEFRYTIGGSTDVFQDLNQANVKIEYPIFNNFLLRLERKEAITQTTTSNEMINELGLKYRFEF